MKSASPLDELRQLIADSTVIVVLTGAGMSTESGIPDFRSAGGIWEDDSLLAAMSERYLRLHPEEFWPKFKYGFISPEYLRAKPNAGHRALTELQQRKPDLTIFTQNVDGLHQAAGSRQVFELHGNIRSAFCPRCRSEYDLQFLMRDDIPRCEWTNPKGELCNTILQPDTVLFGQTVRHYEEAAREILRADLLLILGTSLTVEPVADLPSYVQRSRTKMAIINLDPTHYDETADLVLHAKIGETLANL